MEPKEPNLKTRAGEREHARYSLNENAPLSSEFSGRLLYDFEAMFQHSFVLASKLQYEEHMRRRYQELSRVAVIDYWDTEGDRKIRQLKMELEEASKKCLELADLHAAYTKRWWKFWE